MSLCASSKTKWLYLKVIYVLIIHDLPNKRLRRKGLSHIASLPEVKNTTGKPSTGNRQLSQGLQAAKPKESNK